MTQQQGLPELPQRFICLKVQDIGRVNTGATPSNPLRYDHLTDFIRCYNPDNRPRRAETAQFKAFAYDTLRQRDKVSLDIFWLKDDSLADLEHLPTPEVLAREIAENLQVAFAQFDSIYADLTER
jgi:type I restriction enzyme M protein